MSHHNPTYKDKFTDVHRELLHQFKDQLINNPKKKADVKLAAAIISGQMDSQRVAAGLLRLLGTSIVNRSEGRSRINTSTSLPNVCGEDFTEIAFTLAANMRNKEGMKMFGICPRALPPLPFTHPRLPDFYMSIANSGMLRRAASCALANLNVSDTRNYMLAFDETVIGAGR
jgi:hypothetical protein